MRRRRRIRRRRRENIIRQKASINSRNNVKSTNNEGNRMNGKSRERERITDAIELLAVALLRHRQNNTNLVYQTGGKHSSWAHGTCVIFNERNTIFRDDMYTREHAHAHITHMRKMKCLAVAAGSGAGYELDIRIPFTHTQCVYEHS